MTDLANATTIADFEKIKKQAEEGIKRLQAPIIPHTGDVFECPAVNYASPFRVVVVGYQGKYSVVILGCNGEYRDTGCTGQLRSGAPSGGTLTEIGVWLKENRYTKVGTFKDYLK